MIKNSLLIKILIFLTIHQLTSISKWYSLYFDILKKVDDLYLQLRQSPIKHHNLANGSLKEFIIYKYLNLY
jgi:hypothetical protein